MISTAGETDIQSSRDDGCADAIAPAVCVSWAAATLREGRVGEARAGGWGAHSTRKTTLEVSKKRQVEIGFVLTNIVDLEATHRYVVHRLPRTNWLRPVCYLCSRGQKTRVDADPPARFLRQEKECFTQTIT